MHYSNARKTHRREVFAKLDILLYMLIPLRAHFLKLPEIRSILLNLSRVMRKPDFCLCKNKGADQLRSICQAVFATRIVQCILYLHPKFHDSNFLLSPYRSVCVRPVSCVGAYFQVAYVAKYQHVCYSILFTHFELHTFRTQGSGSFTICGKYIFCFIIKEWFHSFIENLKLSCFFF